MSSVAITPVGSLRPHSSAASRPILFGLAACTPTNWRSGLPMIARNECCPTLPVENWTTRRICCPSSSKLTKVNHTPRAQYSYGQNMAVVNKPSAREAKRLQTRERLMGAAIAEFKRSGMTEADVGAIVTAAGVAHGTFFFHFPTKEHVLLELERREEERIAKQLHRYVESKRGDLPAILKEAVRLVLGLERRLGAVLFKDFLALHFSQTRPTDESKEHPVIVTVAQEIERAQHDGD